RGPRRVFPLAREIGRQSLCFLAKLAAESPARAGSARLAVRFPADLATQERPDSEGQVPAVLGLLSGGSIDAKAETLPKNGRRGAQSGRSERMEGRWRRPRGTVGMRNRGGGESGGHRGPRTTHFVRETLT